MKIKKQKRLPEPSVEESLGRWVMEMERQRAAIPRGYKDWLEEFHQKLKPARYLEIGVETGATLMLTLPETQVFGVDPNRPTRSPAGSYLFQMTSDMFFRNVTIPKVDMSFIDGRHLVEYVLRDFINTELLTVPGGIILCHDVLQIDHGAASRERGDRIMWTGDTWKLVPILRKHRPDLKLEIIDCPPSGLLVISQLNGGTISLDDYNEIVAKWIPVPAEDYVRPDDLIVPRPSVLR